MNDQMRLGTGCYQTAGSTRMIQVDMGWDHIIHVLWRQAEFGNYRQESGHAVGRAGIDEGQSITLAHQIAGRESVSIEAGFNAMDALGKLFDEGDERGVGHEGSET